jgi:hypothetical protein
MLLTYRSKVEAMTHFKGLTHLINNLILIKYLINFLIKVILINDQMIQKFKSKSFMT